MEAGDRCHRTETRKEGEKETPFSFLNKPTFSSKSSAHPTSSLRHFLVCIYDGRNLNQGTNGVVDHRIWELPQKTWITIREEGTIQL